MRKSGMRKSGGAQFPALQIGDAAAQQEIHIRLRFNAFRDSFHSE